MLRRAVDLRERMDDPHCDPSRLRNTYEQFALVNRLVTGWRRVFTAHIAPRLTPGCTLLDVGCGGGDICRSLADWSAALGAPLRITAIDPDGRALDFAMSREPVPGVEFERTTAEELAAAGRKFDFVVSNHLLHHLPEGELGEFLTTTGALTRRLAVHNDLRRHPAAWLGFSLTAPVFRRSFIVEDGLRSIRRSYTPAELRPLLPRGWRLETVRPFRNLAILEL